jgi:hypothetical protein
MFMENVEEIKKMLKKYNIDIKDENNIIRIIRTGNGPIIEVLDYKINESKFFRIDENNGNIYRWGPPGNPLGGK